MVGCRVCLDGCVRCRIVGRTFAVVTWANREMIVSLRCIVLTEVWCNPLEGRLLAVLPEMGRSHVKMRTRWKRGLILNGSGR